MNLRKKILYAVISLLITLFCFTYTYLLFKGRLVITRHLEALTQRKVNIRYLDITPLLNLKIKDLTIQGQAEVDSVIIYPSIPRFLLGTFAVNEIRIIRPKITYERVLPEAGQSAEETPSGSKSPETNLTKKQPTAAVVSKLVSALKQKNRRSIIFKHIVVEDGALDFIDRTVKDGGIKISIKDIKFDLTNLYLPFRPVVTNFDLEGRIPWSYGGNTQEEGLIKAAGWINFYKKDMAASVKVSDIDGVYLYPYYSTWVDLQKARIEKAKLNFTSEIHGFNNNITSECHLELTNIVFKQRTPEEQQEKAEKIAYAVIDIFKTINQGKIVLDFIIKTKMSRPEFGFSDIKMAFEEKLAKGMEGSKPDPKGFLILPAKLIEGTVKSATDISKAVIEGTFAVGNEFKKAVTDSFKREKPR